MIFLLNVVFAVLAFLASDHLLRRGGVSSPVSVVLSVIIGVVVYFCNFANLVIR